MCVTSTIDFLVLLVAVAGYSVSPVIHVWQKAVLVGICMPTCSCAIDLVVAMGASVADLRNVAPVTLWVDGQTYIVDLQHQDREEVQR